MKAIWTTKAVFQIKIIIFTYSRMSVKREYSQRNTNNTKLVPVFMEKSDCATPIAPLTQVSHYHLNITNLQNVGGIYYVDLSDVDSSGNPLDFTGAVNTPTTNNLANIINFGVNISVNAALYPGLEVTVFFKNPPDPSSLQHGPLLSLGLFSTDSEPYIVSPPYPWLAVPTLSQSITFKSDGTNFNVFSSGPAGWYGIPVLIFLLQEANNVA